MWYRGSPVCHVCHTVSQHKCALAVNQAPATEHLPKEMVSEMHSVPLRQHLACFSQEQVSSSLPDSSLKQIYRINTAATNLLQLS